MALAKAVSELNYHTIARQNSHPIKLFGRLFITVGFGSERPMTAMQRQWIGLACAWKKNKFMALRRQNAISVIESDIEWPDDVYWLTFAAHSCLKKQKICPDIT